MRENVVPALKFQKSALAEKLLADPVLALCHVVPVVGLMLHPAGGNGVVSKPCTTGRFEPLLLINTDVAVSFAVISSAIPFGSVV